VGTPFLRSIADVWQRFEALRLRPWVQPSSGVLVPRTTFAARQAI
jgi:hypothetical protein